MGLTATAVSAGYGGEPVVDGVSIDVAGGELVIVVGPNGSGKTTLLRALAGTLPLSSGSVKLGEADGRKLPARERARAVSVVPQAALLEFAFTVREVVEMGRTPYLAGLGRLSKADREAVDRAMERAGVASLAETLSTELSAGQGQLVSLARALAQGAPCLLLDEPTAHLDVAHQIEVMTTVRRLAKQEGMACLAVLHDLNLAAAYADRVALLSKGRMRAWGPPAQVLTRANVAAAFGLDVLVRRHPVSGAAFLVPVALTTDPEAVPGSQPAHARVHVVCGGGTGGTLLTALARGGVDVSVGVLNVLDSDYETAESLGLRVVAEAPFSAVSDGAAAEARRLADAADAVVLAAVPLGPSNLANLGLVEAAARAGKPVFLVDAKGAASRDFTGGEAERRIAALSTSGPQVRSFSAPEDLARALSPRGPTPQPLSRGYDSAK